MVVVVDVICMVGRCAGGGSAGTSGCGGCTGGSGGGGGGGQGHKLSHFIFSVFVYKFINSLATMRYIQWYLFTPQVRVSSFHILCAAILESGQLRCANCSHTLSGGAVPSRV